MVSPSRVIREFKRGTGRSARNNTKRLGDESRIIDVEAREVKPKPQVTDKTMRADKRDTDTKPKGRSGRAAAIAAGAVATAAGVAALSGKDEKKQPASPSAVGAASKTESKKEVQAKAAPAKATAKKGLSDFEKRFKEMRTAGKDTFTWNGKKYTTRYKEESDAQHKSNVAKIKAKNESAYEKKMKEVSKMKSGGMAKKR
jgi:hypothetical protein